MSDDKNSAGILGDLALGAAALGGFVGDTTGNEQMSGLQSASDAFMAAEQRSDQMDAGTRDSNRVETSGS